MATQRNNLNLTEIYLLMAFGFIKIMTTKIKKILIELYFLIKTITNSIFIKLIALTHLTILYLVKPLIKNQMLLVIDIMVMTAF